MSLQRLLTTQVGKLRKLIGRRPKESPMRPALAPAPSPFKQGRRLIFCHIQKTAGTSMRTMLARGLPPERTYPSDADVAARDYQKGVASEVIAYEAMTPQLRASLWLVADHVPPVLFDYDEDRPLLITLLREPVARAVSHLRLARATQRRYRGLSLSDLFEEPFLRTTLVENFQTRFLSCPSVVEARKAFSSRPLAPPDFQAALDRLAAMDFVGFFDEQNALLTHLPAAIGRSVTSLPHENPGKSVNLAEDWDVALHRRIADAVGYDADLYAVAKQRFSHAASAAPSKTR